MIRSGSRAQYDGGPPLLKVGGTGDGWDGVDLIDVHVVLLVSLGKMVLLAEGGAPALVCSRGTAETVALATR